MVTKFIGNVDEFMNCRFIMCIYVRDNIQLSELDITKFTINHLTSHPELYDTYSLVERSDTGDCEFYWEIPAEYKVNESNKINYLIVFDEFRSPIGFVYLNQEILFNKYDIQKLSFNFDYTLINKLAIINVSSMSYKNHTVDTANHKSHLNLLNLNNESASKLISQSKPLSRFTRNIRNIINSTDIYKYSGNLSSGLNRFVSNRWLINKSDLDDSKYVELIRVDNKEYLFLYIETPVGRSTNKLVIYSMTTRFEFPIQIESSLHIGNNLVVANINGKLSALNTSKLVNGIVELISIGNTSMNLELPADISICKDPLTKELYFYSIDGNGDIVFLSNKLKSIVEEFGNFRLLDQSDQLNNLVYASKGLMIIAKLSNDNLYFDNVGLPSTTGIFTAGCDYSINNSYLTTAVDDKFKSEISNMMIDEFVFLNSRTVIINKYPYNKYRVNLDRKVRYNQFDLISTSSGVDPSIYYNNFDSESNLPYGINIFKFNLDNTISKLNLIGYDGLNNLFKLKKYNNYHINDMTLLNTGLDGSILYYYDNNTNYVVEKL